MEKTPVDRLVEDIKESAETRESWVDAARSRFIWAAIVGGSAVYTVSTVKPSPFILGVQVGYALYEAGSGVVNLARASDAGQRVTAMSTVLTQHELAIGEVVGVYPDAEEEQTDQPRLFDQEHPAEA